ncbi:MAG: hypothetical protein ACLQPD_16965 [Desulfomonilaceae bacterium]
MTLNLVRKAKPGDKDSLVAVIRSIQGRLYGLAIRMLSSPFYYLYSALTDIRI